MAVLSYFFRHVNNRNATEFWVIYDSQTNGCQKVTMKFLTIICLPTLVAKGCNGTLTNYVMANLMGQRVLQWIEPIMVKRQKKRFQSGEELWNVIMVIHIMQDVFHMPICSILGSLFHYTSKAFQKLYYIL